MIKLRADGNVMSCVRTEPVVQGQIDTVIAEVELSSAWNGYSVLVVWSAGGVERSTTLTDGRCVVPWEVLARATVLTAAVTGTLGSSVMSTQFVAITQILPGPSAVQMSGTPALSPHEQLVQSATVAAESARDAAERAESTAADVVAAGAALSDLPDKLQELAALKTAIASLAKDAQDSAAITSVAASLLEQYGIISGIESVAIPVQWYTGVASISNKFFVVRSTEQAAVAAVMAMSLDDDLPIEDDPLPSDDPLPGDDDPLPGDDTLPDDDPLPGDGGETPGEGGSVGEPSNPGTIIQVEYAGYVAGWVSGTELYLTKTATGVLEDKHTSTGRWVVLDYATSRYYICLDGVVGAEITTFDDVAIINPATGKLYMTEDGNYWVWDGREYIVADLSTLIGGGQSLLERLVALEIRFSTIIEALEEVV